MFRILCDAPLAVGFLTWRFVPGEDALVLVVKGTYRLAHGGRAAPMDPLDPLLGDTFQGEEPLTSACQYASDVVPWKPRADAMLVGKVHTPEGRAIPECSASFAIGKASLSLLVSGDRYWLDPASNTASEPRPFTEMPLGYERAFGGPGWAANPVGKGFLADAREAIERPLPNIEDPRERVARPQDRPAPAGFGPLSVHWAHRAAKWPKLAPGEIEDRWPWPPEGVDFGYFNAAQPALQIEGYLRGDESIVCENLSAQRRRYECELPRVRPRSFVLDREGDRERFREVGLRLDTLWVDMEQEKLVLVWRGSVPVAREDLEDVAYVYVATESLDEPRAPVDQHRKVFEVARLSAEAKHEPAAPPRNDNDAPKPIPKVDVPLPRPAAKPLITEQESKKLAELGYPPAVAEALSLGDIAGAMAIARAGWGGDPDAFDKLVAQSNTRIKKVLADAGHDPSLVDPRSKAPAAPKPKPGAPKGPEKWNRARVEACLVGDVALAGEDLSGVDLSELDLRGRDLSGCLLQGASLADAKLDEAILTGANLSRALAERCSLRGAKLDEADLTFAALPDAVLTGADLEGALLDDAVLTGAKLVGVKASKAYLRRADLRCADLSKADLREAHLDGAALDGAVLRGADLTSASAEGMSGDSVDLRGSILVRLNASEGSKLPRAKLQGCKGERSRWTGASLVDADFSRCDLRGADFSQADLGGAKLSGSDCFEANFTRAKLRGATIEGARLWAARMEGADLRRANLKGAILHRAGLREARIEGANLEGAVTTGTLLDSPVRGWAR